MKGKKLLSLLLAAVMAAVPFCLPSSAAAGDGLTLDEVTSLDAGVSLAEYATPTVDGVKDDCYGSYGYVASNFTTTSSNAASFEAYYANDAQYLYVYMSVDVPDAQKSLTADDVTRLYIDFLNEHTSVLYQTDNEAYQKAYFNTSGQNVYNGGQFQYSPSSNSASGIRGANLGIGSSGAGDFKFVKSEDTTDYAFEARIKLPDYVKNNIANGKNPVIGVGYEIRKSTDPKYNCSYFESRINVTAPFSYIWADYTLCPDLILSNATDNSAAEKLVEARCVGDASGKTVTVNGTADASEGYNKAPFALVNTTVASAPQKVTDNASSVRVSADASNIYIAYETYNLTSTDAYFQIAFGKDGSTNKYYAAGSKDNFLTVQVELDDTDTPIGALTYGDGQNYAAGDALFDGTSAAVVRGSDKVTAEIKIPIPAALAEERVKTKLDLGFGVKEVFPEAVGASGYTAKEGYDASKALISMKLPPIADPSTSNIDEWIAQSKEQTNLTSLEGLTVNVIGDSYLAGGSLDKEFVWSGLLAKKYSWKYANYAENGAPVAFIRDSEVRGLYKAYRAMNNNTPDVVIVSGGHEDLRAGVPVGDISSTDEKTFMGALNVMFDGMRKKYPDAMFVYTATWNVPESSYQIYADAAEQVCKSQGVYFFKAYDKTVSGVDMTSAAFVSEHVYAGGDYACLKISGMKLVMPAYEKFISDSLADWAVNKEKLLAARPTFEKDDDDGDDGADTGNKAPETTAPPAVTEAPAEEKKGCGSTVGLAGIALVTSVGLAGAFAVKKKKED